MVRVTIGPSLVNFLLSAHLVSYLMFLAHLVKAQVKFKCLGWGSGKKSVWQRATNKKYLSDRLSGLNFSGGLQVGGVPT